MTVMQLFRARIAHFPIATADPSKDIEVFTDGALVIQGDRIVALGNYADIQPQYPDAQIRDHRNEWLVPGFIDSHLHYPQTEIIGHYGEQLLTWLESFTFPAEQRFADDNHAANIAQAFLRQLLKNGTTTGLVFSSVHKSSTDILFTAANDINMAIVAGKVCMDRHCPDYLQDTPDSAQKDSAALIEKWHNKGRNFYALTPRFAPTSSPAQMAALGELAKQYDDVFIQTHLSENEQEIAWVKELYPNAAGYLDVYDQYHMVRPRAVFGHGIHVTNEEWERIAESGASVAFCPTSNLFLGSGLFDLATAKHKNINLALASDVGGGTGFNMLRTYGEAYKICQLRHTAFPPLEGLYMMTQGAATAHGLTHTIGNLNPGTHADFVLINPRFDELTSLRLQPDHAIDDMVFAMSMLADDRAISQTWVAGQCRYQQTHKES